MRFPFERARLDLLWYLGGLGALFLLARSFRLPQTTVVLAWIAAACVSIALNGARDLPQYFVQAHPALAFAAAAGLWPLVQRGAPLLARATALGLALLGLWRVGYEHVPVRLGGQLEVARNMHFDLDYARGRIDRPTYLARFQEQQDAKYVPLAVERLAHRVRETTAPAERVLVFGFSAGVYVQSGRPSASRFFWSRPVIVEFGSPRPRYGSAGLLTDLQRTSPPIVALQKHWGPGEQDPIEFFMGHPGLRGWLQSGYVLEDDTAEFAVWRRRF